MDDVLPQLQSALMGRYRVLRELGRADMRLDGPRDRCTPCLSLWLALSCDAAGQRDSAIMRFRRFAAAPGSIRIHPEYMLDALYYGTTLERLGELYEKAGDLEQAAEHYRAFIDLWQEADPDLQPRVSAAKQRPSRLR